MIDVSKLKYKITLLTDTGRQLDITDITSDLGWEENKSQLALRISCTVQNIKYNGCSISSMAKPGAMLIVFSDVGDGNDEAARGTIIEWNPAASNSTNTLSLVAYDDLFLLQKSQDDYYFAAGTGTRTAILKVLSDWGVPVGSYQGPNVSHAKMAFKAEPLSDILLELLEDAEKKGAKRCLIRGEKGKVFILPRGSNSTVWGFTEDTNVVQARYKISTADMITRVKVVANSSDETRSKVESVIDGKTEFGIRQSIYRRSDDDKLSDAVSAAKDILRERGKPEEDITFKVPDVPSIRKGDKVYVAAGVLDGYYYVQSAQHDAANRTLTMDLEPAELEA